MEGGRLLEELLTKRTDHSVQVKVPAVKCRYERCNSTKCEEDHPEVSTAKAKRIHAADAETMMAESRGEVHANQQERSKEIPVRCNGHERVLPEHSGSWRERRERQGEPD